MKLAVFALLAASPLSLIAHPESLILNPESLRAAGSGIQDARSGIRDSPVSPEVIDRIVAVVGGQPITLSDVTAVLQFGLVAVPPATPDAQAYVVDRLIERTLMLAEVERFQPPEPDPIEMTIRIDELERRAGAAAFAKALAVTGMTREQLRRYLRNDLRITTYLNQRFGTNADASQRQTAIRTWIDEIRRRADVRVIDARIGGRAGQ
jgi:hypothetical protein